MWNSLSPDLTGTDDIRRMVLRFPASRALPLSLSCCFDSHLVLATCNYDENETVQQGTEGTNNESLYVNICRKLSPVFKEMPFLAVRTGIILDWRQCLYQHWQTVS